MSKIKQYLFDLLGSYLVALLLCIPIYNVNLYRELAYHNMIARAMNMKTKELWFNKGIKKVMRK